MKFTRQFNDFLRDTVNLNDTRLDQLENRVSAITTVLEDDDEVGDLVQDTHRQGSWAHKTIIRPQKGKEFDADFLLEMSVVDDWDAEDYIPAVFSALDGHGTYSGKVSRKDRCVRVQYAGQCHVDVVPFLPDVRGGCITNSRDNEFEETDPHGFIDWYADKNAVTNGHLKRVIRLVKYLRDIKGTFTLKSVLLTTLLGERVTPPNEQHYSDLPTTLKSLMNDLADHLDLHPTQPPSVEDPSGNGRTFDHRWDPDTYPNLVKKIRYYADKIDAAHGESDRIDSMTLWREAFGDDFGEDLQAEAAAALPITKDATRVLYEQFIDEPPHNYPIRPADGYSATITCRVLKKDGFRHGDLAACGNRVGKHRELRFKVEHDVPGHSRIYWKVRNHGDEAQRSGDMRGEITRDDGSLSKRETTLYTGNHYVEVYIVRDRQCVAADHYPVQVL